MKTSDVISCELAITYQKFLIKLKGYANKPKISVKPLVFQKC